MADLHPPGSPAVVKVPETSVDRYLKQGWRKADVSAPPAAPDDVAPPKAGRGSSREAWADYAATVGVDVDDEMSRDDIIEVVEGE